MKKKIHKFYKVSRLLAFCFMNFLFLTNATAQNDSVKTAKQKKVTLKGYIKYLHEVSFVDNADDLLTNNLLHNRINFRYEPSSHFNVRVEVRNRLFYGELVKYTPDFASSLANTNEWVDLSKTWIAQRSLVLHSTIDRACAEYSEGKWDITVGRQRINWGINTVWTPSDIFNT